MNKKQTFTWMALIAIVSVVLFFNISKESKDREPELVSKELCEKIQVSYDDTIQKIKELPKSEIPKERYFKANVFATNAVLQNSYGCKINYRGYTDK